MNVLHSLQARNHSCHGTKLTDKYHSFDALSLSYNGGKDCLVLLLLYLSTLHTHYNKTTRDRKGDQTDKESSEHTKPLSYSTLR